MNKTVRDSFVLREEVSNGMACTIGWCCTVPGCSFTADVDCWEHAETHYSFEHSFKKKVNLGNNYEAFFIDSEDNFNAWAECNVYKRKEEEKFTGEGWYCIYGEPKDDYKCRLIPLEEALSDVEEKIKSLSETAQKVKELVSK